MLAYIYGIGLEETLIGICIIMLLFWSKRLPSMARGIGQGMREFKRAVAWKGNKILLLPPSSTAVTKDARRG